MSIVYYDEKTIKKNIFQLINMEIEYMIQKTYLDV